jgi:3-oxosteroid 1-dehydrogenase
MAEPSEQIFDFVIVGSGAGAMCAALVMRAQGKEVLVIEKQAKVGGSTAFSGGVAWIPNNDYLKRLGVNDTYERSRTYLDEIIGDAGPASSPARRDAFIHKSPEMIRFLEARGMRFLHAAWPDYYSDRPGGLAEGRTLAAPLFDIDELGDWAPRLASYPMWAAIPLGSYEASTLSLAKRTWAGRKLALRLAVRILRQKVLRQKLRASGNALQGRMLQLVLRAGVPIWTGAPVSDLLIEDQRVVGVTVRRDQEQIRVRARLGVLLNAGGFAHNLAMRDRFQPKPASVSWTTANPGDTGEMMQAAMALGAAVDLMDSSWWVPASFMPDGNLAGFHLPGDASKPYCIVVNAAGERIGNEAGSYVEFGQRMYANGAVPAWAIFDSRHRRYYPWGTTPPGMTPAAWLESGYMKRASSLPELARLCGVDAPGLVRTVERFNEFARTGVDLDFGRGASVYNRYYGDPNVGPNPCLGALEAPPFHAVAILPADVGTAGGVLTDEHARVLRSDASPIAGLYATGNCTASVMGRCYPGAGASIAASMTFGYIAALHATQSAGT